MNSLMGGWITLRFNQKVKQPKCHFIWLTRDCLIFCFIKKHNKTNKQINRKPHTQPSYSYLAPTKRVTYNLKGD